MFVTFFVNDAGWRGVGGERGFEKMTKCDMGRVGFKKWVPFCE